MMPFFLKTGIRVTASHIRDKLLLLWSMLVGVMVRPSGEFAQGINGAVKASFPAVDILAIGFIFNSSLGNAKLLSVADEG